MPQAIHEGRKIGGFWNYEPLCGRAPAWARIAKRGEMITCKWCLKKMQEATKTKA